jgi:dipeptidyl aminopeptidase/acylaminoacyl peptidase
MPADRRASALKQLLVLFALAALVAPFVLHAQEPGPANDGELAPLVRVRSEDYSRARASFHTVLLHPGPAPEPDSMPPTPAGVQLVTYPSGPLQLNAWITHPQSSAAHQKPAVLFVHGGFSFGPHDWDMCQAFLDSGYVVMTPTLRGENRQPGAFTLFYDEVDDVLAAARWLAREPYVAPDQIFVAGHSNGGILALLAAMASPMFRGAASFSGSPDQVLFCKYGFEGTVPFDTTSAREFEMRSPLAYAGSFRCPARVYYGSEEPYFHRSSQMMAKLAREHGVDVIAERIAGGHFSALKEERLRAIRFFRSR